MMNYVRSSLSFFLAGGFVLATMLPGPARAETLKYGGSSSGIGTMKILLEAFRKKNPDLTGFEAVPGLSSGGGIKAVASGTVDFSVSSRPLKKNEEGMVSAAEYGRTPFVFAVSAKNAAVELAVPEIVAAYAGKIGNWPDGSPIRLVLPLRDDNDNDLIGSLSPAMPAALSAAHARPGMLVKPTDQEQADAMESVPGALGTSTLALILAEKRNLKPLKLGGVAPGPDTLANNTYPLSKNFYIITRHAPSSLTRRFVQFVLSAEGRALLAKTGHVVPPLRQP